MKKLVYVLLIGLQLTLGCKKDVPIFNSKSFPLENDNIKLALVNSATPSYFIDIFYFNASTGIAISNDGRVFKTTDFGASWSIKYINPNKNQSLAQIHFTNANVGYIVGGTLSCNGTGCIPPGGLILKTIDGGNSWTTILQSAYVEFSSIASNSLGELFVTANGTMGRIYKSVNDGGSWTISEVVSSQFRKIIFSGIYGFCTANSGKLLGSIDNGATWTLTPILPANYAIDIKFNSGNGYCIANSRTVYKTTDNGATWAQSLDYQNGVSIVNPLTANSCLVFGKGSYSGGDFGGWSSMIMQTKNAGATWIETEIKEMEPIRCASFYSATEGYAVAGKKLIKVTVK